MNFSHQILPNLHINEKRIGAYVEVTATQQRKASPMTQSLMSQIETRFQTAGQAVSYISADEMAYLQARARHLRAESNKALFDGLVARIAAAFRPTEWQASGRIVTVE